MLSSVHRMRLLVELSRRGTITEVARALSYSPSTISQQIAQLELEAGATLIEPVGRRVRLTAAGDILVRHAERVLVQIDRAEAELAAARSDVAGVVKVATFQTAAVALVPILLDLLAERHPGVSVQLSEIQPDAGMAALMARDFDLVLGEIYPDLPPAPPSPDIDRAHLFSDPMRLYVPQPARVGRPYGTTLVDFADSPWVMEPKGKPARAWAEAACRSAGFEPEVKFESADLFVHTRLAETGHAVALLPELVWDINMPNDSHLLPIPGSPMREVYTAVRLGAETRPVLVAVRAALRDTAEQVLAARHP